MSSLFWLGVIGGVCWNLTSLFCLRQIMGAWLGPHPSRARVIVWMLVKFPLLYVLIILLFRLSSTASIVGFSIGFSLALLGALLLLVRHPMRFSGLQPHVR